MFGSSEPRQRGRAGTAVGRRAGPTLAAAVTAFAVACAPGPTLTDATYREKANLTAGDLLSPVRTGVLLARGANHNDTTTPYTDATVSRAENDALSVREAFATRQPPTPASDPLRARLLSLADDGVSGLAELRIALRRDDRDAIRDAARDLDATARGLERVEERTR